MNGHNHGAHHDGIDHYSNGQTSADEGDTTDGESDDQLDDDMMDKISSSPSIDDGGCPFFSTLSFIPPSNALTSRPISTGVSR